MKSANNPSSWYSNHNHNHNHNNDRTTTTTTSRKKNGFLFSVVKVGESRTGKYLPSRPGRIHPDSPRSPGNGLIGRAAFGWVFRRPARALATVRPIEQLVLVLC